MAYVLKTLVMYRAIGHAQGLEANTTLGFAYDLCQLPPECIHPPVRNVPQTLTH